MLFFYLINRKFTSHIITLLYRQRIKETNQLSGNIPKEISALKSLEILNLFYNSVGGNLPNELGSMKSLKTLDLERNDFTGNLFFPEFFELAKTLEVLRVSINNFEGDIPDLSKFSSLKELWLAYNMFTEDIPDSITKLSDLGTLTTCYPASVESLVVIRLILIFFIFIESLQLQHNNLIGSIPAKIGNLKSLKTLRVNNNSGMSGGIPDSIGELKNLEFFDVSDCGLSGNIPPKFSKLSNLEYFLASKNSFNGNVPNINELKELRKYYRLR